MRYRSPLSRLALLLAFTPVPLAAQATAEPAFATQNGAFFALSVRDMPGAIRWYTETFGLRVAVAPARHGPITVAMLAGGGLEVELLSHDSASTPASAQDPGRKVLTHGLMKVGFMVQDFDRVMATLRSRGVRFVAGPFPPRRDQRANVVLQDNEGNLLQLFGGYAP